MLSDVKVRAAKAQAKRYRLHDADVNQAGVALFSEFGCAAMLSKIRAVIGTA